jgi:integrase
MPASKAKRKPTIDDLWALPARVLTKDRQAFDPRSDHWPLARTQRGGDHIVVRFEPLRRHATPRFVEITKRWLADRARELKSSTLSNYAISARRVAEFLQSRTGKLADWGDVTAAALDALLKHDLLKRTGVRGNDFAIIRTLYRWGLWVAELPDFNEATWRSISTVRAPGNLKGQRVLGRDSDRGPLTPEEVEAVHQAIIDGRGSPRDLVCVQLLAELGLRPVQAIAARWRGLQELRSRTVADGHPGVVVHTMLEVPIAKDRQADLEERSRPVSRLLAKRLGSVAPDDPSDSTPLLWWLRPGRQSQDLLQALERWADDASLVSPRTGRRLHLTGYRFRYTLGMEAARNGASRFQLMVLLDHADLQNVDVYIDAAGTVMQHIEASLESTFAPAIRRFLGRTERASPTETGVIPATFAQLVDLPAMPVGIGRCSINVRTDGVCRLAPPLSCYTCPKFVAFRDGPHAAVATGLEQVARTHSSVTGGRTTSVLLPTIHAIRELLNVLEQQKDVES